MNTDELLEALKPYAVSLSWHEISNVWIVLLPDWAFLHAEHADKREALQSAYDAVMREKAEA